MFYSTSPFTKNSLIDYYYKSFCCAIYQYNFNNNSYIHKYHLIDNDDAPESFNESNLSYPNASGPIALQQRGLRNHSAPSYD